MTLRPSDIGDPIEPSFLRRHVFNTDHKVIGRQYFFLSLAAVLVGAWLSLLMRIHLVWPKAAIPFLGEIKPENYLAQMTMHGTLMVFFVLSTVPQAGFGTFFLPLQLGASNMALPRLTAAGFWTALTSFLILLAFGILLAAVILLMLDRHAGTSFFLPGGMLISGKAIAHSGGSPLLWQHLFWFFGHPEVYIAILPAMGVTSHLLSVLARKPVFGYKAMVGATLAIGALGFMVWGHHMFVSGMNPYAGFAFSTLTTAIAVPSAIKTFNWA